MWRRNKGACIVPDGLQQQVSKSASSILKSSWWSSLVAPSNVVLALTKPGSSCKQDAETEAKHAEDIMDAAFTTIRYFHVERRMLNGAAGSCQWGKVFPLAGFDGGASLQNWKASGARHGLLERKANSLLLSKFTCNSSKRKSDKSWQLLNIKTPIWYRFRSMSLPQYEFWLQQLSQHHLSDGGGGEECGIRSDLINMYITQRTCCIINQPHVVLHMLDTFLSLTHTSICRRLRTLEETFSGGGTFLSPSARQDGRPVDKIQRSGESTLICAFSAPGSLVESFLWPQEQAVPDRREPLGGKGNARPASDSVCFCMSGAVKGRASERADNGMCEDMSTLLILRVAS